MAPDAQNPPEGGPDSEERLLIEAAQKDPTRFAPLYERHVGRIYAYVARRVRDRSCAEDLTSDVFHKALAGLPRFEWRGTAFAAWLYRIAANEIADLRAKGSREHLLAEGDAAVEPDVEARALDDLPADQRRVVLLRFFEQKSIREAAEELDRTPGAVKQLQFRALESLRARMEDHRG